MSTRCYIAKKMGDKVKYIYCHNDGYPEHTGKKLLDCYADEISVDTLIAHGNLSILEKNVERTEFHHRDHGKPWRECKPKIKTMKNFIKHLNSDDCIVDLVYLYNNEGKWTYDWTDGYVVFPLLTQEDCK